MVSVVSVRVDTFRGIRFSCFKSFPVSACKVINLKPTKQIILQKSLVKKSFIVILRRFGILGGVVRLLHIYARKTLFYICMRVRLCVCVRVRVRVEA